MDGCKGITESGRKTDSFEGVHRTNHTDQSNFTELIKTTWYRDKIWDGALRTSEIHIHTYIHIQGGKYAESYHNASVR